MRNIICFLLFTLLVLPLAGCENGDAPKIGVIDMTRLMRDCDLGKKGIKIIEEQQTKMQSQLDELQAKLEKNPSDENSLRELQRIYSTAQQSIQAEGENIVGQIFEAMQNVINNFREKNGYTLLIRAEAADSYDPSLDVTNAIMAEANKINMEFKPLPEDKSASKTENAPAKPEAQSKPDDKENQDSKK